VSRLGERLVALRPRARILAPVPFVLWALYSLSAGERRWEICLSAVIALALACGTPGTKKLFAGVYPLFLVGLLYDAQRFLHRIGLSADRVHTCDLRRLELALFGAPPRGAVALTWPDVLQSRSSTALDLLAAVPYGTFIVISIGYAMLLYRTDFRGLERFTWTFLVLNVLAFVTYRVYPAAPPWYVRARGCMVDLNQRASEGPHLAHVDALLGVRYFGAFYDRSRDVFGAVPSLHVAYPLLIVLEGWRRHRWLGRALAVGFFLSMCFAAVYLDHHWVFDVVVGVLYTIVVYASVRWFFSEVA